MVAKRRISDDAEGFRRLLELLVEAGDTAQDPIPVAVGQHPPGAVDVLQAPAPPCIWRTRWATTGVTAG